MDNDDSVYIALAYCGTTLDPQPVYRIPMGILYNPIIKECAPVLGGFSHENSGKGKYFLEKNPGIRV